jgi:hypothetical protein
MKRLYCWWNGHDYVSGFGWRFGQHERLVMTVCVHCGARHVAPDMVDVLQRAAS